MEAGSLAVQELIGVYDADGSVWGEVSYVVRKLRGTAHCALCDITHAGLRRRASFEVQRAGLGVPFTLLHRDERPPDVLAASGDRTPVVLARTDAGLRPLLEATDLARCGTSSGALFAALVDRLAEAGLTVPAP